MSSDFKFDPTQIVPQAPVEVGPTASSSAEPKPLEQNRLDEWPKNMTGWSREMIEYQAECDRMMGRPRKQSL
jgi:hypothetical protein